MKKNFWYLLLMIGLAATLTACGSSSSSSTPAAATTYDFETDVLPLFTAADGFVSGGTACSTCHFSGTSMALGHEMDLATFAGFQAGADAVSDPGAEPILGQATASQDGTTNLTTAAGGTNATDWGESGLKRRLRNNRMPPGITSAVSRDVDGTTDMGVWVTAGALEATFDTVDGASLTSLSPKSLLATAGEFDTSSATSVACTTCHYSGTSMALGHEMDLASWAGVQAGADAVSDPGAEPILGQATASQDGTTNITTASGGANPTDWGGSGLRARLRNNRMPPGISSSSARTTNQITLVESWITAGALATDTFECVSGGTCQ